jgi:hypothetical protein
MMQVDVTETLIEKIRSLPIRRRAEVEDFVDFLSRRDDERLVETAMKLSEPSFESVWDNDEDAAYDRL